MGSRPVKVFYSYSRKDEDFRMRLDESLAVDKGRGLIEVWWDHEIVAGDKWQGVIDANLADSDIVLLLLSPSFLASKYCMAEARAALERGEHVRIISIHVRACGFKDVPELAGLQMLPKKGQPIKSRTDDDEAWEEVRQGIAEAARKMARLPEVAVQPPPKPVLLQAGAIRRNPKDGLDYVWIPPGRFMMGCSPGDTVCQDREKPAHEVLIEKGFWMGKTPVTQAAYRKVTGQSPSHFKGDDLPVESVTWDEAVAYCKAVGGRLPTEAEWEYAARAGSPVSRYGPLERIAWFEGNSKASTQPVARLDPNGWGLFDMLGNVWEWISDYYGDYDGKIQISPQGPSNGEFRVVRGGSWLSNAGDARASIRYYRRPGVRSNLRGFRCVWEPL